MSNSAITGENFSNGKFVASATGVIRILVIVLLLSSAIIFLSNDTCPGTPTWYDWLFPVVSTIIACIVTMKYAAFVCGIAKGKPERYIKIDSVFSILESIVVIVVSVLTMSSCKSLSSVQKVPGPLGLAAGFLLAISTAALWVSWRRKQELLEEMTKIREKSALGPRTSIVV
ncbi:uncharacterized protein LOC123298062 [Chrysoperla carnea]|uniref:uncharacterized protein LOC123298062 n=1 Tax=Chrysoperla carnea TaxID=189513 RepID=UPI001D07B326|nr:uncharacterized protein LOC123298062 [Chrysoperla carnea]XP_044735892.1 uncharacterized protein LOC123298062 [Chrysoperla carnea]